MLVRGILVNFAVFFALCLPVEVFLWWQNPQPLLEPAGNMYSENGRRFGWGFAPYQSFRIDNPDTGASKVEKLNSHGWRDIERSYENKRGAFRILVFGDSVTFGPIVPLEKLYTRVVESKLNKAGFNVEVINLSVSGWGTDNALEALQIEGLKYNPDLVIFQFSTNDPLDNVNLRGGFKPFYYQLTSGGELERIDRTAKRAQRPATYRFGQRLIAQSQILTRLWNWRAILASPQPTKAANYQYVVSQQKISQLKYVLPLDENHLFLSTLKQNHQENEVFYNIEAYRHLLEEESFGAAKRILEKRWFDVVWDVQEWRGSFIDTSSPEWRLQFALFKKAHEVAQKAGAEFAILNATDEGIYQWELSWYRIENSYQRKRKYLHHIEILKEFAQKHDIGFVPNKRPYERARNDSHQNSRGYWAMSEDLYDFLLEKYAAEMKRSSS